MKKMLVFLMALVMLLSCFVGFSVSSGAEDVKYVEPTYAYSEAVRDYYGKQVDTEGVVLNEETGTYDCADGFFLGDRWTYEYYNFETEEFNPMTSYVRHKIDGFQPANTYMYVPFGEAGFSESIYTYCAIWSNGKVMHPGTKTGPVITFIAPANGTISYEGSIKGGGAGDYLTIWLNDEMVYPSSGNWDDAIFKNIPNDNPLAFEISSLKVEEGDLVRLCVMSVGGSRSGRSAPLVNTPVVTYLTSDIPIGNPNGEPPTEILTTMRGKKISDTDVIWKEARNAVGYNLYVRNVDAEGELLKVNTEPVTDLKYTITGLDFDTMYELTMTSVTKDGNESVHSDPVAFKTPRGDGVASDKDSDTSNTDTDVNQDGTNKPVDNNNNNGENAGFPWLIVAIAGAAVVVIAVVVVLVLVLGKKKKAVAAPVEETAAEAPAEEEKKDEE